MRGEKEQLEAERRALAEERARFASEREAFLPKPSAVSAAHREAQRSARSTLREEVHPGAPLRFF